jgi:hypothetical protein
MQGKFFLIESDSSFVLASLTSCTNSLLLPILIRSKDFQSGMIYGTSFDLSKFLKTDIVFLSYLQM